MKKYKKLFKYLFTKPTLIMRIGWDYLAPVLPDEFFTKVRFKLTMGYWMDFNNPQTYNEKLQWLKLNDIHPEFTKLVDKIDAKEYIAKKVGKQYIIPTIATWNSVDEINWDTLPNQFVIKSTNDSGGVVVCKDKSRLNIQQAK